jgi:diguanylate cyclase (GGDEF)-like protein
LPTKLKASQYALLAFALVFCLGVFLEDVRSSSDYSESYLLALSLVIVYPVKRDWATLLVLVCSISAAIASALLEPGAQSDPGTWANRGCMIAVMSGVAFMVSRVTAVERTLFQLSTSDPLTGAFNRRHFMGLMNIEEKRAERYGTQLSLLMLDIDHFKKINDTYGHQTGDVAIKVVAQACRKKLRPTDILCRYGGEEFIIVLPQTDEAGAVKAAEYIREAIGKLDIEGQDGRVLQCTVSIGVSAYIRHATTEQLIECADQALYVAKQSGRNQVQVGRLHITDPGPRGASALPTQNELKTQSDVKPALKN